MSTRYCAFEIDVDVRPFRRFRVFQEVIFCVGPTTGDRCCRFGAGDNALICNNLGEDFVQTTGIRGGEVLLDPKYRRSPGATFHWPTTFVVDNVSRRFGDYT